MKFRKKPVVIEAMEFNGKNGIDIISWAHAGLPDEANSIIRRGYDNALMVRTAEGWLTATVGNWIIKGVKGEFYPIQDDIFHETYDPVG